MHFFSKSFVDGKKISAEISILIAVSERLWNQ